MYRNVAVPAVETSAIITGGTVVPVAGSDGSRAGEIPGGSVAFEAGTITWVGAGTPGAEVGDPRVFDATGCYVTPGLIEAHAHMGVFEDGEGWAGEDTNEMTDPNGAGLRALDAINPRDLGLKDALRGGVTSAVVKPGSGNPIGGRTAAIKTWGRIVDEMLIKDDVSVKSALGENPKRVYGEKKVTPSNRMGVAYILREAFTAAQDYKAKKAHALANGEPFERDLGKETLVQVLDGQLVWDQHCHRADDIATAVRLSKEFGYRLVVNHGTEGHLIADYLAEHQIDCIVGPLMTSRSKVELRNRTLATPAALAEAGVKVALTTDHPVVPINFLILEAALCVKEGLDPVVALEALTINPATMLGLDDRVGSLTAGKDADIVVWSGHPLDLDSRVLKVFVGGRLVYTHQDSNPDIADPFGPTPVNYP